jgi:hypothetical protein
MRSPWSSRTRLACSSSPSSRHRAPGWPPAAARLARSTGGTASGMPPSSYPTHRLPSVKKGRATRWVLGRGPQGGPARRDFKHDRAGTDQPGGIAVVGVMERPRRRCRRRVRAPAPAADRPLSRPPGQIPRRQGAASRARGVPAGPRGGGPGPGPGRRGPASTPPPGAAGARPAGRAHPPRGDSAGIRLSGAVLASGCAVPEGPSPGGLSGSPSLRGSVAVAPRVGPQVVGASSRR